MIIASPAVGLNAIVRPSNHQTTQPAGPGPLSTVASSPFLSSRSAVRSNSRPIVLQATNDRHASGENQSNASDTTRPGPGAARLIDSNNGSGGDLNDRISSGEFTDVGSTKEQVTRPLRKVLAKDPVGPGRLLAYKLAQVGREWRAAAARRMPEARGDIREIVGEPVFVPLYKLFQAYGKIFRLSFGPKSFVIISDAKFAKQILLTNASNYSKGILAEILDFVMGKGLIPADGEIWKIRRRAIVPALHKKYIASMVDMFGDCALHGSKQLETAHHANQSVEMEDFFSRLALDIIGKAVFNFEFDSLTKNDPVIKAVYTVLREAEYRSVNPIPYWNIPPLRWLVPRQRRCMEALEVIESTLDELIAKCKRLVEEEDDQFVEEFLSEADPSILHFLIASGEQISSKQLRDDLMTLLIAGHETTAAVLTWTMYCLSSRPDCVLRLQQEVDSVLGDRKPTVEDIRALRYTTRVINESMRLYPQPPVLIRRALEDDVIGGYPVPKGSDLFISVWNLHRSPQYWDKPHEFNPDRFPVTEPIPNEVTQDFAYLPFGGGKRKCIGDQFALFESIVALSMLVRRFEFSLADDAPPVGMTTGATIHTTNGLYMRLKPRTSSTTTPSATSNGVAASQGMPHDNGAGITSGEDDGSGTGNGAKHNNGNGNGNGVHSTENGNGVHSEDGNHGTVVHQQEEAATEAAESPVVTV